MDVNRLREPMEAWDFGPAHQHPHYVEREDLPRPFGCWTVFVTLGAACGFVSIAYWGILLFYVVRG